MTMEGLTLAGRGMAYEAAFFLDKAKMGDKAAQARVDLMTPVVKSWCTDNAVEVASLGVQIHGGMGFIEETGAALYYRDARILPIYEGTNGIQANDLVFRKILRDNGDALTSWIADMKSLTTFDKILKAISMLEKANVALGQKAKSPDDVAIIAVPYLNLLGVVAGSVILHRIAKANPEKEAVLEFYCAQILPRVYGFAEIVGV